MRLRLEPAPGDDESHGKWERDNGQHCSGKNSSVPEMRVK